MRTRVADISAAAFMVVALHFSGADRRLFVTIAPGPVWILSIVLMETTGQL